MCCAPVAAVIAVVLVASTAMVPAGSGGQEDRYGFLQFNMCGHVCNDGSTNAVVDAVAKTISDFGPAAVSLNEVCESQFKALLLRLARAGHAMKGRWVKTMEGATGCAPRDEGIALLAQSKLRSVSVWRLPRPRTDVRTLLCASIVLSRRVKVCATHIAPYDPDKAAQIRSVVKRTRFGGRVPTVLMGDFNVTPSEDVLDLLYTAAQGGGAHGRFREVDEADRQRAPCRCGEPTLERIFTDPKIDYIFVSARHWTSLRGDATYSSFSDHDPLRGSAVLGS